ncbi:MULTISPECIES: GNAT family N-acetyltransferase [unclassified Mesorhizobium]|uniref:GNAT family N-acetyltransferase n=1 Tax=unclassified Mesorhizobium TaxID=325217 RepID=UPI000FCBE775|nr:MULTISPECIES: GNAT family N-acetyltransferase [unclassified Mesorhizobium]RUX07629.1 N-acetyltransferase [Mesorhizobium sp. M8A.F.Ca.ET.059.01.1.1]RUW53322.1 N-acetyltransferase [Mesorhizobium sp. M8A.F.Ca.ET.021.01.1.1]TGP95540.1 N-acetyltransferase [Mesorhizobium sp. M8A.F.Ca.ET.218.01.1.1]TGT18594.1 N-acetyltransferase [Mesorhizobium sp. M8A.F.Ca.ET.213.01.1.1]TGT89605.1 N-acetyltransferase [Mesorhizobium sp. M8A.F.Ca.ET.161.01.1.1]
MELKPSESLKIDAFSMRVSGIEDVDLDRLHALSLSVNWPHRAEDWQFLRDVGEGFVVLDEIGRVLGSAMWFRHGADFATVGMVITSPRLQTLGAAQWLMKRIFDEVTGRDLRLNATRAAKRLYLSLDFQPEKTVYQCQGIARAPTMAGSGTRGDIRTLDAKDIHAVIALDAAGFGVRREALIEKLFAHSVGYGLFKGDTLSAFALCRPFGRGHVVGPVVAESDADAVAIVQPHVAGHSGSFLRVDTHMKDGEFAAFLAHSGMPVYDTVLTMSIGKRLADFSVGGAATPMTFALASQTLG